MIVFQRRRIEKVEEKIYKGADNIYIIPLNMSEKDEEEWTDDDVKSVAYQAAVSVIKLCDKLVEERGLGQKE